MSDKHPPYYDESKVMETIRNFSHEEKLLMLNVLEIIKWSFKDPEVIYKIYNLLKEEIKKT